MKKNGISQYQLLKSGVIDNKQLNRLKNDENITLNTLSASIISVSIVIFK